MPPGAHRTSAPFEAMVIVAFRCTVSLLILPRNFTRQCITCKPCFRTPTIPALAAGAYLSMVLQRVGLLRTNHPSKVSIFYSNIIVCHFGHYHAIIIHVSQALPGHVDGRAQGAVARRDPVLSSCKWNQHTNIQTSNGFDTMHVVFIKVTFCGMVHIVKSLDSRPRPDRSRQHVPSRVCGGQPNGRANQSGRTPTHVVCFLNSTTEFRYWVSSSVWNSTLLFYWLSARKLVSGFIQCMCSVILFYRRSWIASRICSHSRIKCNDRRPIMGMAGACWRNPWSGSRPSLSMAPEAHMGPIPRFLCGRSSLE